MDQENINKTIKRYDTIRSDTIARIICVLQKIEEKAALTSSDKEKVQTRNYRVVRRRPAGEIEISESKLTLCGMGYEDMIDILSMLEKEKIIEEFKIINPYS